MGKLSKVLLLFFVSLSFSCIVFAQDKTVKSKREIEEQKAAAAKKNTTKFTPPKIVKNTEDAPPQMEKLEEVKKMPAGPVIDFDTTAAPDDAFTKDIKTLLKTVGALETDVKVAEQTLMASFEGQNNEMVNQFSTRFIAEMKEGRVHNWLENLYIRTYRNAYTQTEVQELIQFYATPLGKKMVATMPSIMTAVMSSSQKIGKYLGQKIIAEIEAEKN